MSIKINKDLAKFINKTCKDEGLDKAKYIDRLLWDGIKLDIQRVTEKTTEKKAEAQEEAEEAEKAKAYLPKLEKKKPRRRKKKPKRVKPEFGKHDFSKGIF